MRQIMVTQSVEETKHEDASLHPFKELENITVCKGMTFFPGNLVLFHRNGLLCVTRSGLNDEKPRTCSLANPGLGNLPSCNNICGS